MGPSRAAWPRWSRGWRPAWPSGAIGRSGGGSRSRRAPPEHVGLGLGTQIGLGVARLACELAGWPDPSVADLAALSGRGLRSGIGLHGFGLGGLIVDGGRRGPSGIPPLLARLEFPREWSILVVIPPEVSGLHGPEENPGVRGPPGVPRGPGRSALPARPARGPPGGGGGGPGPVRRGPGGVAGRGRAGVRPGSGGDLRPAGAGGDRGGPAVGGGWSGSGRVPGGRRSTGSRTTRPGGGRRPWPGSWRGRASRRARRSGPGRAGPARGSGPRRAEGARSGFPEIEVSDTP